MKTYPRIFAVLVFAISGYAHAADEGQRRHILISQALESLPAIPGDEDQVVIMKKFVVKGDRTSQSELFVTRMERDMERLFERHSADGQFFEGKISVETSMPVFSTFADNIAGFGKDVAKFHGYYDVKDVGLLSFHGGLMIRPKGREYWWGIKTVKHTTGLAIEWRYVDWRRFERVLFEW